MRRDPSRLRRGRVAVRPCRWLVARGLERIGRDRCLSIPGAVVSARGTVSLSPGPSGTARERWAVARERWRSDWETANMRPVRYGTARGAAACDPGIVACARDPERSNQGSGFLHDEGVGGLFREPSGALRRGVPRPWKSRAPPSGKDGRALSRDFVSARRWAAMACRELWVALGSAGSWALRGLDVPSRETGHALVELPGVFAGARACPREGRPGLSRSVPIAFAGATRPPSGWARVAYREQRQSPS
jgi:hypothetical protein